MAIIGVSIIAKCHTPRCWWSTSPREGVRSRGQEEPAPSGQLKKSARLLVLSERLNVAMQTSLARRGRRLAAVSEHLRQAARGYIPPRRSGDGANPRQRLEVTDDEGEQSDRL
jgi:hypothetical protein